MTEKELLEALLAKMNGMELKMTNMEGSLSDVKQSQSRTEQRMDCMEARLEGMDDRFDGLAGAQGRTNERLANMEGSLARMENELGTKVAALFDAREVQNDVNAKTDIQLNKIDTKIDRISADVTFLVRKAAEHEDDIRSLRQIK